MRGNVDGQPTVAEMRDALARGRYRRNYAHGMRWSEGVRPLDGDLLVGIKARVVAQQHWLDEPRKSRI